MDELEEEKTKITEELEAKEKDDEAYLKSRELDVSLR